MSIPVSQINSNDAQLAAPRRAVTPESVFNVRVASQAEVSPDGKQIVFLVGEWLPDQTKRRNRLWITDTANNDPHPLTRGKRRDQAPAWSPDSRSIAFASTIDSDQSDPHAQLYVQDVSTGDERLLCSMPNGIHTVSWSPDGKRIAFCSLEGEEPAQDPRHQYANQGRHKRLWTMRIDGDIPEAVTPDGLSIWHYVWSPNSKQFAVYYANGPEETDWYRGQIGLVAANGGSIRQVNRLTRQAFALTWSPDSTQLAYVSGEWSDPDRGGGDIYIHSFATNQTRHMTPDLNWSPTWLRWYPDGQQILCAGWKGLTTRIATLDAQTGTMKTLSDDFLIGDRGYPHLSTSTDMQHIAATHSHQHPHDVWLGKLAFENNQAVTLDWQRITRLNPLAEETFALNNTEHIRYKSVDGWMIEALVTWPKHEKNAPLPPLVVHVHGGPSGVWLDDWESYHAQILAAAGFAVLRPNIRGSMGGGVAFADAVIGDMGGKDLQDVLKGVDYLVERKLVDAERIGIMGWSYGGFMTAWTVTQTTRFKAAVMDAGISDYHSFHAQTNIQDWDMRFLGKVGAPISPLTHPETYRERSPITYARHVATPTLIVHGENDACVPLNQAYAFYRALSELGVPVELVTYPREGHGLTERQHNLDYVQRTIEWFQSYL
ncbi:alpha/beta hydrolase family protein [Dictyobacter arantiisoli]|uniref:Peptidase n=1 Tax=Dictyobacter arantiisoli TaxID=2014874 RepID=A0A5A5T7T0_9CHLR|nr:S9 family peptidase [Dictyobacter arantiisoli]GCF06994.1 peptidase [Dictyobacter arantiisoli]